MCLLVMKVLLGSAVHCRQRTVELTLEQKAGPTSGAELVLMLCLSLSLLFCEVGILSVLMISLHTCGNHMEVLLRTCGEVGSFSLSCWRSLGMEEEHA